MDDAGDRRLGLIQALLILGAAFLVLAWLYVMLVGVRPPSRSNTG